MVITGAFMILAASFEFWKRHNAEIVERPTDDDEVRQVRKISHLSYSVPLVTMLCLKRALTVVLLDVFSPMTADTDAIFWKEYCVSNKGWYSHPVTWHQEYMLCNLLFGKFWGTALTDQKWVVCFLHLLSLHRLWLRFSLNSWFHLVDDGVYCTCSIALSLCVMTCYYSWWEKLTPHIWMKRTESSLFVCLIV